MSNIKYRSDEERVLAKRVRSRARYWANPQKWEYLRNPKGINEYLAVEL